MIKSEDFASIVTLYKTNIEKFSGDNQNFFAGMNVHGIADYVLTNGKVVVDNGEIKVVKATGRYIKNVSTTQKITKIKLIKVANSYSTIS